MTARKLLDIALLIAAGTGPLTAQSLLPTAETDVPEASSSLSISQPAQAVVAPWEHKFDRWVDLKDMTFGLRYRSVMDSNNAHQFNQGQNRSIVDGKFKFDQKGKYGIAFHASTGHYFNWAYSDFIGGGNKEALATEYAKAQPMQQFVVNLISNRIDPQGTRDSYASGGWAFYVRRLYLDLEPLHGFELQYGSMDLNRGAASEITTYDNDGYMSGERLIVKRPHMFF